MTEAAGGPAFYVGDDMKRAHEGMGNGERDWAIFMEHATATLDYFEVPDPERGRCSGSSRA
jgi:hemoglobin